MEAALEPRFEDRITVPKVQRYLRCNGYPDAMVVRMSPLGAQDGELKGFGYGRPLAVRFQTRGSVRTVVLRTSLPNAYGHERRADRVEAAVLAFDTFADIPGHARALDVGAFDEGGNLVSFARGEPFLVTEYVEGTVYAAELREAAGRAAPRARDLARAHALARYLAELHRAPAPPAAYVRAIRDTVGHGEGIFGIVDNYPDAHPVVPRSRVEAIEQAAVRWRSRLRAYTHRSRRTHGDFHPFNILFQSGTEFAVLDASRGGAGDPADDVVCLAINYLFFALIGADPGFRGAMRGLWDEFWRTYLDDSGDRELLETAPLFFAWRALVLASPAWYPQIADDARARILGAAERLLTREKLSPDDLAWLEG